MLTRNLISFSFVPDGFLVLLLFRNVVTEFSEIDDLADRRVGGRRHFHQVEPHALGSFDRLGQFHDAELLAGRAEDDADFAGANPAVYTNLLLQNLFSPGRRRGSETDAVYSYCRNLPSRHSAERAALGNLRACEERADRSAAWPGPRGSSIRHRETRKVFRINATILQSNQPWRCGFRRNARHALRYPTISSSIASIVAAIGAALAKPEKTARSPIGESITKVGRCVTCSA